jgi:hypothetical protein
MHMLAQHQRANNPSQAVDPFGGINLQIFRKSLGGSAPSPESPPPPGLREQHLAIEGPALGLRYGSQASFGCHASGSQDGSQSSSASHAAGAQPDAQNGVLMLPSASLAAGAQPVLAAAAASSVDTMVERLRLQLLSKKGNLMKRPAAAAAELVDGRRLGCSKCRYGPGGCKQCKAVDFTGKRHKD